MVQVDWDGKVVWKFDHKELVDDDGDKRWIARQHHDYQREGNPVGYYVPGMECKTDSGNTLILCHEDIYNKKITEHRLLDDVFIEVDWEAILYGSGTQISTSQNWDLTRFRKTYWHVIQITMRTAADRATG